MDFQGQYVENILNLKDEFAVVWVITTFSIIGSQNGSRGKGMAVWCQGSAGLGPGLLGVPEGALH